jgi:hypothetical protein
MLLPRFSLCNARGAPCPHSGGSAGGSGGLALDCLATGILKNHLPQLIPELLPIVDEMACIIPSHYLGAFLLKGQR